MALLGRFTHRKMHESHRPWPRADVADEGWQQAIEALAKGKCTLLGLWGDAPQVQMALLDEAAGNVVVLSYTCKAGKYPSVAARHPPAVRFERAIYDLFGLQAVGSPDTRAWLDLGFWNVAHPLGKSRPAKKPEPYEFLPVAGDGLHQIPVGPVHAGIIEPGHFRFTANGEHVVRLEQRLGWVHKGIESLMDGAALEDAAKLASRTSGDSTVAYAFAFAQAAEAALQVKAPPRAIYLRALMAELERLANHFGDVGAICNDASFSLMHAQCGILRERTLRAAAASFGHRLMMDVIVPGGVACDIALEGIVQVDLHNSLQCDITCDAARHDDVHHQAVTERSRGRAQCTLAQDAALRMHEGKRGVVADGADIAEMIGEPLQLRHQRAQIDCAWRRLYLQGRLRGLGESECISNRAVTGRPRGKLCCIFKCRAVHQRLDALVHPAKTLLEPHHMLAIGGEAEMTRLDDPGVDWPDRDLM